MTELYSHRVGARTARWRVVLLAVGAALLLFGASTLLTEVDPAAYAGLLWWIVGAIVVHDGIAAMVVLAVTILLRRAEPRVPFAALAVLQAGAALVVVVTAVVVPEIVKQGIGSANPTLLPLDYLQNLVVFDAAVIAAAIGAAVIVTARSRRRERRP